MPDQARSLATHLPASATSPSLSSGRGRWRGARNLQRRRSRPSVRSQQDVRSSARRARLVRDGSRARAAACRHAGAAGGDERDPARHGGLAQRRAAGPRRRCRAGGRSCARRPMRASSWSTATAAHGWRTISSPAKSRYRSCPSRCGEPRFPGARSLDGEDRPSRRRHSVARHRVPRYRDNAQLIGCRAALAVPLHA